MHDACSEWHSSCLYTMPFPKRSPNTPTQPFYSALPMATSQQPPHPHPHITPPSMHICVTHNHVPMPPHPRRCYLNSSGSDGSTGFPPILHGSPSPQQHRCPPTPNLGMGMWQTQGIGGFSAPFCWWGGSIPPFSPPIFPLFPPSFIPPPPKAGSALWLHHTQQSCTLRVHPMLPPTPCLGLGSMCYTYSHWDLGFRFSSSPP